MGARWLCCLRSPSALVILCSPVATFPRSRYSISSSDKFCDRRLANGTCIPSRQSLADRAKFAANLRPSAKPPAAPRHHASAPSCDYILLMAPSRSRNPPALQKIFFLPNAASPSAEPAPTLRTSLSIRTAPPSEPPPAVPSRQPIPQSGDLRHQLRPNRVATSNQPSPQPADPPCVNKPPAPTMLTEAAKRKLRLNKMFRMRAARPAVPHAAPGPEHRAGSAGSGAGASKQGTEPMPEEEIEVILDLHTKSDSSRPASPADAQLRTPPFPRRSPAFAPPRRRGRPRSTDPAFLRRRPLLPSLANCVPPLRGHAPRLMEPRPMPPLLLPLRTPGT